MMSVLLFISSIVFVQVDLIPFRQTNQQSSLSSGPEIFRKAAINSLIPLSPQAPQNKTKSSGNSYFNF
jgi:hypothetical protein